MALMAGFRHFARYFKVGGDLTVAAGQLGLARLAEQVTGRMGHPTHPTGSAYSSLPAAPLPVHGWRPLQRKS